MKKPDFQNSKPSFQNAESCILESACILECRNINELSEIQNAECKFCILAAFWKNNRNYNGLRQNAE